jgi:TPR repeat protein
VRTELRQRATCCGKARPHGIIYEVLTQASTAIQDLPMADDTMIYWLAQAAKDLRERARRKPVHVAAAMSIDQSTIYRFEQGQNWPRDTDLVIAAYAEATKLKDPREVWDLALKMWRDEGEIASVDELVSRRDGVADALAGPVEDLGREASQSQPAAARSRRAPRRRAAG